MGFIVGPASTVTIYTKTSPPEDKQRIGFGNFRIYGFHSRVLTEEPSGLKYSIDGAEWYEFGSLASAQRNAEVTDSQGNIHAGIYGELLKIDLYHVDLWVDKDTNTTMHIVINELPNQAFTRPSETAGDLNKSYED